jgi:uncharacterized membrane protein
MHGVVPLGRPVFWVLILGLVMLVVATAGRLPPVVASHFDVDGAANGWSTRPFYVGMILVIGGALPLGLVWLIHAVTRRGPALLNIPSADYWRQAAHAAEAVRRVRAYTWWLACILVGTGMATHALVLAANATQPPRLGTWAVVSLLAGVLGTIGLWTAGLYVLLRPPSSLNRGV